MLEGADYIEWNVMRVRLYSLKREIAGLKGRRSAYAGIKREYGLRGTRQQVCKQLEGMLEALTKKGRNA